ncbi:MAG: ABC transporter substrate-binding protein [Chthoniobacterales bacterium]|nr:ABC transporter substrate-binding protein [Chthoniobacterales bacterium]
MAAYPLPLCLLLCAAGFVRAEAEAPRRVVSLAPSITQTVIAVGATDRLVAVTPFCAAPASIPRIKGGIQPDAETVLGFAPDLVLLTSMTPEPTRRQLTRLGLRAETIDSGSLDDIRANVSRVAVLLGTFRPPPPATASSPATRSAALLFGAEGTFSAGCGTHAHEIMQQAGLRNIAADAAGPWPQLGEEFLLSADPDLLVVADYNGTSQSEVLKIMRNDPVRRHLRAVEEGRVVVFPAGAFTVPGPGALAAGEELRAQLGTNP